MGMLIGGAVIALDLACGNNGTASATFISTAFMMAVWLSPNFDEVERERREKYGK